MEKPGKTPAAWEIGEIEALAADGRLEGVGCWEKTAAY